VPDEAADAAFADAQEWVARLRAGRV
jgi:prephenate dehydratase